MADDMSRNDWWRPPAGSKAEQRVNFAAAAVTIATGSLALAAVTWTFASTQDGRMKALLWWCFGISSAGAFLVYQIGRRESREVRYARALQPMHEAHHLLRDAAYLRYIAGAPEVDWKPFVIRSLQEFAAAFSVATGAKCHATIKRVDDPSGMRGRTNTSYEDLEVDTFARSSDRSPRLRAEGIRNTVGRNTDFRQLFSPDADHRCWHNNDLLRLDGTVYDNPHWPANPTRKNVDYRSTMVWPIRKVIREGSQHVLREVYVHGFLTIDSMEPNIIDYDRHFELGAAYADHLLSVCWDPTKLRLVHLAIQGNDGEQRVPTAGTAPETPPEAAAAPAAPA